MTCADHDSMRALFEAEFHSRTLAYLPGFADDGRAVVVELGAGAHTAAGHAIAHTLVNLLARAHRHIVLVGDFDRALMCGSLFGVCTLEQATIGLARAINPYIEIEIGAPPAPADTLITLGVGDAGADYDLGADRWAANIGDGTLVDAPTSIIGAALAGCLGSFIAFNAMTGHGPTQRRAYSAWDLLATETGQGPDLAGPLDVGRVLCAGAGAVASALAFFAALRPGGIDGNWGIVDGDLVDVSNLNRQIAFVAADAGWPDGSAANKAESIAEHLGPAVSASPQWWHESTASAQRYDVVLALANEKNVRSDLANTQPTVLLHATTSTHWQSQVHRHVAGRDDCLDCRLPSSAAPQLKCSTAKVDAGDGKTADAALPFLSATSGLLLLVQLLRLQTGHLVDGPHNFAAVDFDGDDPGVVARIASCRSTCRTRIPYSARQNLDAASKWVALDGGRDR